MSTTDMTNPWRRGSKTAGAKHKRRAAIVRAQSRRKAKAECRHETSMVGDCPAGVEVRLCPGCGARLSLGPSNDDVPEDEMRAVAARCSVLFRGLNVWILDGGSTLWSDDCDGWPWDPTRPVAGQYEQWQETLSPLQRLGVTEVEAANAHYAAKQNALDAHGYAKPGEAPAEVVGLEVAVHDVPVDYSSAGCDPNCELCAELAEYHKAADSFYGKRSDDSDAPAATYEPGGAE